MLSFKSHSNVTRNKLKKGNNMLKALTGCSCGKEKEIVIQAYKTICRPIKCGLRNLHIQIGQICISTDLVTGCHVISDIDHLHSETKILPVQAHNEMLVKQYLATCQKMVTLVMAFARQEFQLYSNKIQISMTQHLKTSSKGSTQTRWQIQSVVTNQIRCQNQKQMRKKWLQDEI